MDTWDLAEHEEVLLVEACRTLDLLEVLQERLDAAASAPQGLLRRRSTMRRRRPPPGLPQPPHGPLRTFVPEQWWDEDDPPMQAAFLRRRRWQAARLEWAKQQPGLSVVDWIVAEHHARKEWQAAAREDRR